MSIYCRRCFANDVSERSIVRVRVRTDEGSSDDEDVLVLAEVSDSVGVGGGAQRVDVLQRVVLDERARPRAAAQPGYMYMHVDVAGTYMYMYT